MKYSSLFLCAVLCFVFTNPFQGLTAAQEYAYSSKQIAVNQMISPAWPIKVETAVIMDMDQKQVLTGTVRNQGQTTIHNIEFIIAGALPDGSPDCVALWQQPVSIAPGQSVDFTYQLGLKVKPGTSAKLGEQGITMDSASQVALSITNVKTDSGGWKTDQRQSLRSLNRFAMGEFIQPIKPEKY
jgi:hypothetical protein